MRLLHQPNIILFLQLQLQLVKVGFLAHGLQPSAGVAIEFLKTWNGLVLAHNNEIDDGGRPAAVIRQVYRRLGVMNCP